MNLQVPVWPFLAQKLELFEFSHQKSMIESAEAKYNSDFWRKISNSETFYILLIFHAKNQPKNLQVTIWPFLAGKFKSKFFNG